MEVMNVFLTNSVQSSISRMELIDWINKHVCKPITRIEEMSTGTVYCFMLDRLFPGSVPLNQVKISPKLEHEKFYNFKILEAAFRRLGVQKQMDLDKLARGRFQENFQFLQWFYKFFEMNFNHQSIGKQPMQQQRERSNTSLPIIRKENTETKLKRARTIPMSKPEKKDLKPNQIRHLETEGVQKCTVEETEQKIIDALANDIDQYELDMLCTRSDIETKQLRRDIYKRILGNVEILLHKQRDRYFVLRRAFTILNEISNALIEPNIVIVDDEKL